MQKDHDPSQHPLAEPLRWPQGHGEVRVTAQSPRSQPDDLAAPGVVLRKTLVAVDIACLFVASIPFFICEVGLVSPVRRGFFCNDSNISYPLQRAETVSDFVLISVGILVASIVITLGETYRVHNLPHSSRSIVSNRYVAALYKEIGAFLFGCTVGQSLTNMAKIAVGRLRPHFLAVCRPNLTHINCSAGYLEDYVCTGGTSQEKEARCVKALTPQRRGGGNGCLLTKAQRTKESTLEMEHIECLLSFHTGLMGDILPKTKIILLWPCLLCHVYHDVPGVLPAGTLHLERCSTAKTAGPVCAADGSNVHRPDPHF